MWRLDGQFGRETTELPEGERQAFLDNIAFERMHRITELVDAFTKSWKEFYTLHGVSPTWYLDIRFLSFYSNFSLILSMYSKHITEKL